MAIILPKEKRFVIHPGSRDKYFYALEQLHKLRRLSYNPSSWEHSYHYPNDQGCISINLNPGNNAISFCSYTYYMTHTQYGKIYKYDDIFVPDYNIESIELNLDKLANKLK